MTAPTRLYTQRFAFLDFLAIELAPREGRWASAARIAIGSSVAVAIAMVFQIPQPNYVAYIGFAISKDESHGTIKYAIGGMLAITLALVLTLGLCIIDTAEPALRLPLMASATFTAMFTARTFALGPISYLAGFVIVMLQSVVDDAHSLEALTRLVLWMWVVILVPVVITIIVNLVWGQSTDILVKRSVRKVIDELAQGLIARDYQRRLPEWRSRLLPLLETLRQISHNKSRAGQINPRALAVLLEALVVLESFPNDLPDGVLQELAMSVVSGLHADHATVESQEQRSAQVVAFVDALTRFQAALEQPHTPAALNAPHAPRRLFVSDAFTNSAHWQFALKTTIAVMASYAAYTLLDWPGLRTAIVTCFFVALGSLGETMHKLVLRISGAAIGGLIAGLCIVFVLPHLTDIGQLALLVGSVSLGAAWVATSSERLAYAGMQIAFAFLLGVLQGYVPATDLTVLRDRLVGILLGNLAITLVFSSLWPTSAALGLRAALADALHAIAAVLKLGAPDEESRTSTVQALVRAEHFRALSSFELRMLPMQAAASRAWPAVNDIDRLAAAAFVTTSESIAPFVDHEATAAYAQWAALAADSLSRKDTNYPKLPLITTPAAGFVDGRAAIAQMALLQLDSRARDVAAAVV